MYIYNTTLANGNVLPIAQNSLSGKNVIGEPVKF